MIRYLYAFDKMVMLDGDVVSFVDVGLMPLHCFGHYPMQRLRRFYLNQTNKIFSIIGLFHIIDWWSIFYKFFTTT